MQLSGERILDNRVFSGYPWPYQTLVLAELRAALFYLLPSMAVAGQSIKSVIAGAMFNRNTAQAIFQYVTVKTSFVEQERRGRAASAGIAVHHIGGVLI